MTLRRSDTGRGFPRLVKHTGWFVALLVSIAAISHAAYAQRQVPTDYVFIVDVSGSMVGKGGSTNIFPQVQQAISAFISQIGPGSEVYIVPFESHVREMRRFPITGPDDIASAKSYVNGLVADGNSTAIYSSVNEVLATVNRNRSASGSDRTAVFFVYTDGNDNVSTNWSLRTFLENFKLKRGKRDWLFYSELGLPRNTAKEGTFGQFDRMRYVQENKGGVHPIVQIETLLPLLNFGNLKTHSGSERVERFATRGKMASQAPVTVRTEPSFPDLQSRGVLAQVRPESFPAGDSIALRLSLTNAEGLPDADYHGVVHLIPSDPLVLVVPSDIEVSFSYGAEHEVQLLPGRGKTFPLEFADIQATHLRPTPDSVPLSLQFSSTAVKAGSGLDFTIVEDPSNPSTLGDKIRLRAGGISATHGTIPPNTREAALVIVADSGLVPGRYKGQIRFEGNGLSVKGEGLKAQSNGAQVVDWSFKVARRPIPIWIWIALVAVLALAGGLIFRHLTKPALLTDLKLEVLEPTRQTIDLQGRNEAKFGSGQELLPTSPTTFSIKARKSGRSQAAIVELLSGDMTLKKQGTRDGTPILGDEEIFDGDLLQFGDHRVRVSSFSLVRE